MNPIAKKYYLQEMHLFKEKETAFVFMPRNLQLYEIDNDTYEELKSWQESHGTTNALEIGDEALEEAGILYEDEEPREDIIKQWYLEYEQKESEATEKAPVPIKSMVLQIANDCNLNCKYCYGDGGSYGRKRELMTSETARKAVDFMVANSGDTKELTIVYFGGEPLINFEVVKDTFDYCKSIEESSGKHFSFTMTTNGTILTDEIYHFIKDNKISVMISMDGGEELQNKHRCYNDGRGSFDDIVKNIERFKDARGGYLTARATVCSTDIRFKKIKDDLLALGFTSAVTSMVDTAEDSELFVGGENTERILEQYRILADDYVQSMKNGTPFYYGLFEEILHSLYFKNMKIRACGAGNSSVAVGTDEKLYPCHRYMGMLDFAVGSLDTGFDEDLRGQYRQATVYEKEECKDCWVRYLCSGSCSHTSAVHSGDIFHAPKCYCEIYKGLYEILLHVYWELKEWNEDYFRNRLEDADKSVKTL